MSNFEHWIKEDSTEFEKAFLKIYDGNLWTAIEKMKDWGSPKKLLEVPQFVVNWFEEQLNNDKVEKFDGNTIFRIIQDVIKVCDGASNWGHHNITDKIAEFAENNEEVFIDLIVNCSIGSGYTVKKELYIIEYPLMNAYVKDFSEKQGGDGFIIDYTTSLSCAKRFTIEDINRIDISRLFATATKVDE